MHISCLARFVQIDTNNLFDEELNSFAIPDDARASADPKFILNLCSTCLELYNQLFSVRLMNAYAALTKQYSEFDNRRIHAYLTYGAFLRPQDPEASKRILLKEVLEKIREFPRDHPGIEETIQWKFTALLMLAETCRDMGDMAGAMLYASRARDFGNDVYDPEDPFMQLLLEYQWEEEGQSINEHLRLDPDKYKKAAEPHRAFFGPDHGVAILHDLTLAEKLWDEGKVNECDETLKNTLERAIRFLGLEHDITLKVVLRYVEIEARMKTLPMVRVYMKGTKIWEDRNAILAPAIPTSGGEKFVCMSYFDQNAIFTLASIDENELYKGSAVRFHHITKAKDCHINEKTGTIKSYHANRKQYDVKVEDDPHSHHMVKPQNIEVVFERIEDD